MKRNGVINKYLSTQLAGLGHTDIFMLCDAGFPIPRDGVRIDLALSFNVPTMKQCLKAILDEIVVEEITIAEEMEKLNKEGMDYLLSTFMNQKKNVISQERLVEYSKNVKFYVRCGELAPYSNIILKAGSGVEMFKEEYIVNI